MFAASSGFTSRRGVRSVLLPSAYTGIGPTESRTPSIHFDRSRREAARVMSKTARTPFAPWKYASLNSWRKVRFPMMSKIIMSTWTGRPCIDPRDTDFVETTAPSVRMYDSSKAPDTKRWMRLVFPTPSSPTRQILNLNVFASGSTVGFRIIIRAIARKGVIKPAARFSESGTDWLEALDVRDRADPSVSWFERRSNREAGPRPVRRDEQPVDQTAADPAERNEGPDLRMGEPDARPVDMGHRHRRDAALGGDLDGLRELGETILAEESGGEVVEATRGATGREKPTLVAKGDEEPLPRDARGVDVIGLHVPLPMAELSSVRGPLEERHRSPSRRGRKYRMSSTLPRRSSRGLQATFTRIPIRISSFVISP